MSQRNNGLTHILLTQKQPPVRIKNHEYSTYFKVENTLNFILNLKPNSATLISFNMLC